MSDYSKLLKATIRGEKKKMALLKSICYKRGYRNKATYQLPVMQRNVNSLKLLLDLYNRSSK